MDFIFLDYNNNLCKPYHYTIIITYAKPVLRCRVKGFQEGIAIFTAESQRTLREMFFSFPLRGRKAKIVSPTGHDGILYPVTDTCP